MKNDIIKAVFWNINKRASNIELILKHGNLQGIDVVALCEVPDITIRDLYGYREVPHIVEKHEIKVFVKPHIAAEYTREPSKFCLLRVNDKYIFAVVHLNSKLTPDGTEYRKADIIDIKNCIRIEEEKIHNKNSLIIGDLNENIFSDILSGWTGFNIRYFKSTIKDGTYKRHEQQEDVFYSPMLQIYKDSTDPSTAKGTYYYRNSGIKWFCFDQLLMKKSLADSFDDSRFKILNELCNIPLVINNVPDKNISDHLPIYFEISGG